LTAINNKILNFISIRANNKIFYFNINDIKFGNYAIREIKIDIIKYYLNNLNLKNSLKIHLFNILFTKNRKIHKKACLIKFLSDNNSVIEEITASFLSKKDITLFTKFNIKIKKIKSFKINITSFLMIYYLIIKKIQYYQRVKYSPKKKMEFNPNIKYFTLLRAFFEITEDFYLKKLGKSFDNTIIYVRTEYYKRNLKKHLLYLEQLKTNKRNYFCYIPKIKNFYNVLKKAIKIYFSSIPNEYKISILQIIITRIEIDDLVNYINNNFPDIREFYTSEDGDPHTTYMTEKIQERNIKVTNLAHGLNVYGPIVNYDLFYVFSKIQKNQYMGTSKFKFYKMAIPKMEKKNSLQKKFALFFICTCFLNSRPYNSAYKDAIDYIERIAREYNIPIYAKYHPRSIARDKILSKKIIIINQIEDLPREYNYLAITLSSTYVMELLNSMPFLIINHQNKLNLGIFYPTDDLTYVKTYQEFKEKIEKFMRNPNYYNEYWNILISLIYSDDALNII
ncbi:hypothetical protein LCGC14_0899180, partial [marine sediment metagenome]